MTATIIYNTRHRYHYSVAYSWAAVHNGIFAVYNEPGRNGFVWAGRVLDIFHWIVCYWLLVWWNYCFLLSRTFFLHAEHLQPVVCYRVVLVDISLFFCAWSLCLNLGSLCYIFYHGKSFFGFTIAVEIDSDLICSEYFSDSSQDLIWTIKFVISSADIRLCRIKTLKVNHSFNLELWVHFQSLFIQVWKK